MIFRVVCFFCLLPVLASDLAFGETDSETLDRIAAVVGNQIILESELRTQVALYATQMGMQIADSAKYWQLRQNLLEQMINDRLILIQAEKDTTLKVNPREVDAALDEHVQRIKSQFASEEVFAAQLAREGLTERELRKRYREEVKNQILKQRLIQSKLAKVTISTTEVEKFYETNKDSLPEQPRSIRLAHILLIPVASRRTIDSAHQKAEQILAELKSGADFAEMAAKYSDDSASGKKGGDLGFFSKQEMVPEFERVAFALRPGEISGIVTTSFGFHIIKCEVNEGQRVRARHILISVQPSVADEQAAQQMADSLYHLLLGGSDFGELAKIFSKDEESKKQGGELGWYAVAQLEPEVQVIVESLEVGEVSKPYRTQFGIQIYRVLQRLDKHRFALPADFDQIKEMARRDKTNQLVNQWLIELRKKTFVEIKSAPVRPAPQD